MAAAAHATRQVGQEVNQLATTAKGDARRTIDALGKAAVVSGAAILAGFGLAVRGAVQLEREMRNVATISDTVRKDLGGATRAVIEMSKTVPQSAVVLAKGLYDIASSGFAGAEGMVVLKSSAVAASAGLTDTATAARAITAVLNAYGKTASESSRVSDVLFQTVNLGVVTFEELAGVVGDFVGSAAAAGVPIEHASAALATMTLSGISASEAGTSLNRVLQSLIDPSDAMREKLKELGYESGIAAIEQLGLKGTMDLLRESTGGNIEELVKLFPEIRAARGALALMAAEGENYNRVAKGITDETALLGATQRAYTEQSKSLSFQWDLLTNQAAALGLQIGTALIPVVRSVVGFFSSLVEGISNLPGPVKTTLAVLTGLSGILLTVGGSFLLLAPKIKAARDLFNGLTETAPRLATALRMTATTATVLMGALAVGAVLLAAYSAKKAEARKITEGFVEALKAEKEGVDGAGRAYILKELAESKSLTTMQRFELSARMVTDAVMGNKGAVDDLARSLADQADSAVSSAEIHRLLVGALGGSRGALNELRASLVDAYGTYSESDKVLLDFVERLGGLSAGHDKATTAVREQEKAQEDLVEPVAKVGQMTEEQKKKFEELDRQLGVTKEGTEELTEAQKNLGKALESFAGTPSSIYAEALRAKQEREREAFDKLHEGTEEGKADWEDFVGKVKLSLAEYAATLEQRNRDIVNWQTNLVTVSRRAGADVATILAGMGQEGVTLTAQMANGTEAEVTRMSNALREHARVGGQNVANELEAAFKIANTVAHTGAKGTAEEIAKQLNIGVEEVKRIAAQYGIKLAEGINPVITAVGGRRIELAPGGGPVRIMAEGGLVEDHRPQIAKGGEWRIWAEPETGGEAYIPLTPAKRRQSVPILAEVAKRFGFALSEFAAGGFTRPEDVPRPPTYEPPYRPPVSTAAAGTSRVGYEEAVAFMQRNAMIPGPGTGSVGGTGWKAITAYLDRQAVPYRVTSTLRPGAITASGNLSLHALGKAVDMVGDMRRIFNTLANTASSLRELFYDPMGRYVKNGRWVSGAIGGHSDHVHAATFDQGGWLPPGLTLARNNTGVPERVVGPGGGASVVIHGPLATITVQTSARVDERAFESAVRDAVEPALETMLSELTTELRGA